MLRCLNVLSRLNPGFSMRQSTPSDRIQLPSPGGALRTLFGIDTRSLALFRIMIGAILLADLAIRATDLSAMYTDDGMFPREVIYRHTSTWNWSFHFGSGSLMQQAVLMAIAAGLAIALLVGYETRIAVVGSWLMLVSIQHRVPPINSGADVLLRMLLFWAMFLPLDRVWSLDRWLDKRRGTTDPDDGQSTVLSVASAAVLIQMALVYLFSGVFKLNDDWLGGTAIAGSLAHDFYGTPLGERLLPYPGLLAVLTWLALALECAAPVLLFIPKFTPWLRIATVAALAAMHLGIGLLLKVDLFSPVSWAGLTLFLPEEFWNCRLVARFAPPDERGTRESAGAERSPLWRVIQGLCAALLVYAIAVNINTLPSRPLAALAPETWQPLSSGLGLRQKWGMFAQVPDKDGWYVAKARLRDGSEVDLLRAGAKVDWTRPEYPAGMYPNFRWRKVFREMAFDDEAGFQVFRAPVAEYLCRSWNAQNPAAKQVTELDLVYCMESAPPASGVQAPNITREQLLHLDLSTKAAGAK
jgi:hypothetical protein